MKGEVVESEWVLNATKAEDYLKKVHDDENQVYTIMAECLEKYGIENKERTDKFKKMADFGIIAISSKEGGTINIEKGYTISKMQTAMYFDLAASYYEKLDNIEKAEELRKELEIVISEFSINRSTIPPIFSVPRAELYEFFKRTSFN